MKKLEVVSQLRGITEQMLDDVVGSISANLTEPELDLIVDEVRTDSIMRHERSSLEESIIEFHMLYSSRLDWVTRGWVISMCIAVVVVTCVAILRPRRVEIVKVVRSDPWGMMRSRWTTRATTEARVGALTHDPPPPKTRPSVSLPDCPSTCSSLSYTQDLDLDEEMTIDATKFAKTCKSTKLNTTTILNNRPPFRVYQR